MLYVIKALVVILWIDNWTELKNKKDENWKKQNNKELSPLKIKKSVLNPEGIKIKLLTDSGSICSNANWSIM